MEGTVITMPAVALRGLTLHDGGRGLFVVCNWGVQTTEMFFNTF